MSATSHHLRQSRVRCVRGRCACWNVSRMCCHHVVPPHVSVSASAALSLPRCHHPPTTNTTNTRARYHDILTPSPMMRESYWCIVCRCRCRTRRCRCVRDFSHHPMWQSCQRGFIEGRCPPSIIRTLHRHCRTHLGASIAREITVPLVELSVCTRFSHRCDSES